MIIRCEFDQLDFFDSDVGEPQISGSNLIVPIFNLGIDLGEGEGSLSQLPNCRIVFCGVKSSERTVWEYASGPEGNQFKPARILRDEFGSNAGSVKSFELEGVTADRCAWVDWKVEALDFWIEVPRPPCPP